MTVGTGLMLAAGNEEGRLFKLGRARRSNTDGVLFLTVYYAWTVSQGIPNSFFALNLLRYENQRENSIRDLARARKNRNVYSAAYGLVWASGILDAIFLSGQDTQEQAKVSIRIMPEISARASDREHGPTSLNYGFAFSQTF